jgi:hypothetical protein
VNVLTDLQVWNFLITFADVLGLSPVTLDEFVQSLHDYVSSLFLCTFLCFFGGRVLARGRIID